MTSGKWRREKRRQKIKDKRQKAKVESAATNRNEVELGEVKSRLGGDKVEDSRPQVEAPPKSRERSESGTA